MKKTTRKPTLKDMVSAAHKAGAKVTVSLQPKRQTTYYCVHWVINGHEHNISCGQWGAADQAVRAIGAGATVVTITKARA